MGVYVQCCVQFYLFTVDLRVYLHICQTGEDNSRELIQPDWMECCYHYWLAARYQLLHFASQTLVLLRSSEIEGDAIRIHRQIEREREREKSETPHRPQTLVISMHQAASPFPHPSIYLPSTHPSPLSPRSPCRAGLAFHLLSVPARSSPFPLRSHLQFN